MYVHTVSPFGQCPYLQVIEDNGTEMILSQSYAITRYVAALASKCVYVHKMI